MGPQFKDVLLLDARCHLSIYTNTIFTTITLIPITIPMVHRFPINTHTSIHIHMLIHTD